MHAPRSHPAQSTEESGIWTHMESNDIPRKMSGVLLRISWKFFTFCKGYPLGFHWHSVYFAKGTPKDFIEILHISRRVPLRISLKFLTLCKGYPLGFDWNSMHSARGRYPLGFHWNSIYFARGTPQDFIEILCTLQGVPLGISLKFHRFCKGCTLRISLKFIAFCKGYPLGFH
jgi:hypothetical protein